MDTLRAHGLDWHHVDEWVGDVSTSTRTKERTMSNVAIRSQVARYVGVTYRELPYFHTPTKFVGSVLHGLGRMSALMGMNDQDGEPLVKVHPRCTRLINAMERFRGRKTDPVKDVLDAARYPFEMVITMDDWLPELTRLVLA